MTTQAAAPAADDVPPPEDAVPPLVGASDELAIPPAFRDVIGYHLRIAQEASFQAISDAAGKKDLRPGWYSVLTILDGGGEMTPSELSRVCGRDRSTLTSTLKALDAQGLIERRRNPEDLRSYSVRLTGDGRRMLARLREVALEHDRRLDRIVGDDKAALIAILQRVVTGLSSPGAVVAAPDGRPEADAEPIPADAG